MNFKTSVVLILACLSIVYACLEFEILCVDNRHHDCSLSVWDDKKSIIGWTIKQDLRYGGKNFRLTNGANFHAKTDPNNSRRLIVSSSASWYNTGSISLGARLIKSTGCYSWQWFTDAGTCKGNLCQYCTIPGQCRSSEVQDAKSVGNTTYTSISSN